MDVADLSGFERVAFGILQVDNIATLIVCPNASKGERRLSPRPRGATHRKPTRRICDPVCVRLACILQYPRGHLHHTWSSRTYGCRIVKLPSRVTTGSGVSDTYVSTHFAHICTSEWEPASRPPPRGDACCEKVSSKRNTRSRMATPRKLRRVRGPIDSVYVART